MCDYALITIATKFQGFKTIKGLLLLMQYINLQLARNIIGTQGPTQTEQPTSQMSLVIFPLIIVYWRVLFWQINPPIGSNRTLFLLTTHRTDLMRPHSTTCLISPCGQQTGTWTYLVKSIHEYLTLCIFHTLYD